MLHFSVSGQPGKPLVILLHGVSNSGLWWAPLTKRLGSEYLVVAIDALGHGQSRRFTPQELEDPFGATVAEAIATIEFVANVANQVPVLVGHSMGGAVATKIAESRPDLVGAALLADPAWLDGEWKQTFKRNAPEARQRTKDWSQSPAQAIAENAEKRPQWAPVEHVGWLWGQSLVDLELVSTGIVSFSEDWLSVLRRITVPVLALTSDGEDCIVADSGVRAVQELGNPCVSARLLPGGTHAMVPEFLDDFLRELESMVDAFGSSSRDKTS